MLSAVTTRAPVRRRSTALRVGVAMIVLAGLLVATDRISLAVAERAVAVTVQKSEHLAHRPSVSIAGFPFLTQFAAGHYDRIQARVQGLIVDDGRIRLRVARLDVTLRDVHVSRDFSSGRSGTSTAQALIRYPDLSDALGAPFGYAGNGRVEATATVSVGGVSVSASATAALHLNGTALTFADPAVTAAGQSVPVGSYFGTLFGSSVPLTGLPFEVRVRSAGAAADGIHITLAAAGLMFSR